MEQVLQPLIVYFQFFLESDHKHSLIIYNQTIPNLIDTLNQGNWIIGRPDAQTTPEQVAQHIHDLRAIYLQNFSTVWQKQLNQLMLNQPETFADVQTLIHDLTNKQSALSQLITIMLGNATLNGKGLSNDALKQFLQQLGPYKTPLAIALTTSLKSLPTRLVVVGPSITPLLA